MLERAKEEALKGQNLDTMGNFLTNIEDSERDQQAHNKGKNLRASSLLSMNVGIHEEEKFGRRIVSKEDLKVEGWKRRDGGIETCGVQLKLNSDKICEDYRVASFDVKLDLNSHDASSHSQQFDLNGFGWNC